MLYPNYAASLWDRIAAENMTHEQAVRFLRNTVNHHQSVVAETGDEFADVRADNRNCARIAQTMLTWAERLRDALPRYVDLEDPPWG